MKQQNERTIKMNKTKIKRPLEPSCSNVAMGVGCWYDEDRQGWWFQGLGFDFMAYWTTNDGLECDGIERKGDDKTPPFHLMIDTQGKPITADIFATIVVRELGVVVKF